MCEGEFKVRPSLRLTKRGFGGAIEEVRVSFDGKQAFSRNLVGGRWGEEVVSGDVGGGGAGVSLR